MCKHYFISPPFKLIFSMHFTLFESPFIRCKELYAAILGQYLRPLTPAARSAQSRASTTLSPQNYQNQQNHQNRRKSQPSSHHGSASSQGSRNIGSATQNRLSAGSRRGGSSRPNSRHRKSHKPPIGCVFYDYILCLSLFS